MNNFKKKVKDRFFLLHHSRSSFSHPFLIALGITGILWAFYQVYKYADLWNTWMVAGGNSLHFCEQNRWDMLVIQPSNTWSNMGYLVAGLMLISVGLKDHFFPDRKNLNNLIARFPAFTVLLGASMIYLFIGSFFYHASLTLAFQKIDITGIYAVLIALFTYNAFKAFPFIRIGRKIQSSHKVLVSVGITLNILFFVEIWKWNINVVFPVMIGLLFLVNLINMKRNIISKMYMQYMWSSFLTLLVAGTIWILDRSNVMCVPTSVFQGHALWHILTAVAVLFLYFYYRSEEFDLSMLKAREMKLEARKGINA